MVRTTRFDAVDYLDTEERQVAYIAAALESGDADFARDALGLVARARGMAGIAKDKDFMAEQILDTLNLPDCKIVLLDWSSHKEHRLENLVWINGDSSLKWRAALPQSTGPDCFVTMALDDDQLRANTMSGFAIWLDLQTGSALKALFTK